MVQRGFSALHLVRINPLLRRTSYFILHTFTYYSVTQVHFIFVFVQFSFFLHMWVLYLLTFLKIALLKYILNKENSWEICRLLMWKYLGSSESLITQWALKFEWANEEIKSERTKNVFHITTTFCMYSRIYQMGGQQTTLRMDGMIKYFIAVTIWSSSGNI